MTAKKFLTVFFLILAVSVLLTVTVSAAEPEGGVSLSSAEDIVALLNETLGIASEIVVPVLIVIGLLEAFFGYSLLRLELVLGGFAGGAFLGKFLADGVLKSVLSEGTLSYVPMLVLGIIGAILAFKLFKLAVFLGVGFAAFTLFKTFASTLSLAAPTDTVAAVVVGLVIGLLAVKFLRPIVILITSISGAFLVSSAVSGLVTFPYADLIVLAVVFLLGLLAQRRKVKRKR